MKLFELKRFFVVTLLLCLGVGQSWAGVIERNNVTLDVNNNNYNLTNGTVTWDDGYVVFTLTREGGSSNITRPTNASYLKLEGETTYNLTWAVKDPVNHKMNITSLSTWSDIYKNKNNGAYNEQIDFKCGSKTTTNDTNHTSVNFTQKDINITEIANNPLISIKTGKKEEGLISWIGKVTFSYYLQKIVVNYKLTELNHFVATPTIAVPNSDGGTAYFADGKNTDSFDTFDSSHPFEFKLKAEPEEDYEFMGWSDSADGSNIWANSNVEEYTAKVECTTDNPTQTPAWYAIFKEINYYSAILNIVPVCNDVSDIDATVSVSNDGQQEGSTTEQQKTFNFTLSAVDNDKYEFQGWKDTNGNDVTVSNGQYSIISTTSNDQVNGVYTNSVTLYAIYKKINNFSATAKVEARDVNGAVLENMPIYVDGKLNENTKSADPTTDTSSKFSFKLTAEDKGNYEFMGWAKNPDGTPNLIKEFPDGEPTITTEADDVIDKDVEKYVYSNEDTWFAIYKVKNTFKATVTVKTAYNGKEGEFGTVSVTSDNPQEWAKADVASHEFTFAVKAENDPNDDYEFLGWSEDISANDFTLDNTSASREWNGYKVTCNANSEVTPTLYAIYQKKNTFLVTVNAQTACDGKVGDFGTARVTSKNPQDWKELTDSHEFIFSVEAQETNDNYVFLGWSESINATSFASTTTSSPNATWNNYHVICNANKNVEQPLYAIFTEKVDLTATVNVDVLYGLGGSVKVYAQGGEADPKNPTTCVQTVKGYRDQQFKFTIEAVAADGYKFVGWRKGDATNNTSTSPTYNIPPITCNAQEANKVETYHAVFESTVGVYIRNRETGRFLKSGGDVNTLNLGLLGTYEMPHMVVGNYPVKFTMSRQTNGFYFYASEADKYLALYNNVARFTTQTSRTLWTLNEIDGFYEIYNGNNYLTAATTPSLKENPNYSNVNIASQNNSKSQQWEILTEDDLRNEMNQANVQNPINVSWLMKNPNFDITFNNGWNYTAKGDRINNDIAKGDKDNYVSEFFIPAHASEDPCDHSTNWYIKQTINDIPQGWYIITCQALQRVNYDQDLTDDSIVLYGKSNGKSTSTPVVAMYSLKEQTTNALGGAKVGNYYYPDGMSDASKFFKQGYYKNSLLVYSDGSLEVGIEKTSQTAKENTTWCCFDNFQLYYLGDGNEQPTMPNDYTELDTRHNAEFDDDGNLVLTGLWRVLNEQELVDKMSEIEGNDEEKKAENSPLVIDATNATLIAKPKLPDTANKNTIIKVKDAGKVQNDKNVIDEENNCANLVLDEKYHFAKSELKDVTAASMTVKRSFGTDKWNTFCVPFKMTKKALRGALGDEEAEVAELVGFDIDKKKLKFAGIENDIVAGTPYLVWVDDINNDGKSIETELKAENVTIGEAGTTSIEITDNNLVEFQGTFDYTDTVPTGESYYIISSNKFYCVNSEVKLKGFRGYFIVPGGLLSGALSASFDDDDVTGITSVNEHEYENNNLYNIAGMRVNENAKGIIIKNGKKYIVK